jgi:hypothetical protein
MYCISSICPCPHGQAYIVIIVIITCQSATAGDDYPNYFVCRVGFVTAATVYIILIVSEAEIEPGERRGCSVLCVSSHEVTDIGDTAVDRVASPRIHWRHEFIYFFFQLRGHKVVVTNLWGVKG